MIKLQHLKNIEACPLCSARITGVTQDRQHTNGQWFETVTFACRGVVAWVPNFTRAEWSTRCRKSNYIARNNEKQAKDQLLRCVDDLCLVPSVRHMWKQRIEELPVNAADGVDEDRQALERALKPETSWTETDGLNRYVVYAHVPGAPGEKACNAQSVARPHIWARNAQLALREVQRVMGRDHCISAEPV